MRRHPLLKQYDVEPDPRYRVCVREALMAVVLFVGTAVVALVFLVSLGLGRAPEEMDWTWGLPSYLFWGVLVTQVGYLVALAAILRFFYRDIPLSPERSSGEAGE